MTDNLHPCWPGTAEPVLIGQVGLIHVTGETPYHSAYVGWWVHPVDEINRDVIRFGCGEQVLLAEVVGRVPELTAGRYWELSRAGEDTDWATAPEAVAGLRALGCTPPAVLLAEIEHLEAGFEVVQGRPGEPS